MTLADIPVLKGETPPGTITDIQKWQWLLKKGDSVFSKDKFLCTLSNTKGSVLNSSTNMLTVIIKSHELGKEKVERERVGISEVDALYIYGVLKK